MAIGPGKVDALKLEGDTANPNTGGTAIGWYAYLNQGSPSTTYIITSTIGTTAADSPAAWVAFRDAEYPRTYYNSDWPSVFTHLATITTDKEPTRYCWSNVRATAVAGVQNYATPEVCRTVITPEVVESRNVLGYPANTTVAVDLDDDWQYGALEDRTFRFYLSYKDAGSDTLEVSYKDAELGSPRRTRSPRPTPARS